MRSVLTLLVLLGVVLGSVGTTAPPPPSTMVFVGDVMLGRGVAAALEGDWASAFAEVHPRLADADLALANLESPLTGAPFAGGRFDLRAPPDAVQALAAGGLDLVSLANNHALDGGPAGLAETLETLERAGVAAVVDANAGSELEVERQNGAVVTVGGLRVAVLGLLDGGGVLDTSGVARAAAGADLVVVMVHWGVEYEPVTERQRTWAHGLVGAGADLIIGSGPHVLQPVEQVEGAWVAYSLGNFLFDQPFADTREGAILQVTLKRGRVVAVEPVPTVTRDGRVRPAGGDEAAAILERLRVGGQSGTE